MLHHSAPIFNIDQSNNELVSQGNFRSRKVFFFNEHEASNDNYQKDKFKRQFKSVQSLPPLPLRVTPPRVGMTEMVLPVSATDEVVEVAGAEVALAPPLPQTIGVMADREEPVII